MEGLNCNKLEWIKLVCSCCPAKRLSPKLVSSVVIYCFEHAVLFYYFDIFQKLDSCPNLFGQNRWDQQMLTAADWQVLEAPTCTKSTRFVYFSSGLGSPGCGKKYFHPTFQIGTAKNHILACHRMHPTFSVIPRFDWNWNLRLHSVQFAHSSLLSFAKLTLKAGKLENGSNRKPQFREGRKFTWTSEHSHSYIVENKANPDNLWRDMSI